MRGKQSLPAEAVDRPGITPACAGKTKRHPSTTIRIWDHPRVCGENLSKYKFLTDKKDHPRVCGENVSASPFTPVSKGSPPRVRGKHRPDVRRGEIDGITPACAGKTPRAASSPGPPWDHPRVCGENLPLHFTVSSKTGSPPRVRGKRRWKPAVPSARRDHPRVCGENASALLMLSDSAGSPPRVRGKHLKDPLIPILFRAITVDFIQFGLSPCILPGQSCNRLVPGVERPAQFCSSLPM